MNHHLLFSVLCAGLLCGGCASLTSVELSAGGRLKTVSMTSDVNKEYRVIRHVEVKQRVPLLFLMRVVPGSATPDINELLEPELVAAQGDAIVNVKISGSAALGDMLLPIGVGVVGGLALAPLFVFTVFPLFEDLKTYTVEGDIVEYTGERPLPASEQRFDPATGQPVRKPVVRFDPATGLPIQ